MAGTVDTQGFEGICPHLSPMSVFTGTKWLKPLIYKALKGFVPNFDKLSPFVPGICLHVSAKQVIIKSLLLSEIQKKSNGGYKHEYYIVAESERKQNRS